MIVRNSTINNCIQNYMQCSCIKLALAKQSTAPLLLAFLQKDLITKLALAAAAT